MQNVIGQFSAHQAARGLSPKTIRRRCWTLAKFDDVTSVSIDELEAVLAGVTKPESKKALVGDLRQFIKWARRRGIDVADPLELFDSVRVPRRAASPLAPAAIRTMLERAEGTTLWAIAIAAYTGLRMFEVAALEFGDVRHDAGVIVVRCGKGGRSDVVRMPPALASILPRDGSGAMFPTMRSGNSVSARIKRHMVRCGVAGRPHDIRHTFGTEIARMSNGNAYVVQTLMRHASASTSERYVRWGTAGLDVVDRLFAA